MRTGETVFLVKVSAVMIPVFDRGHAVPTYLPQAFGGGCYVLQVKYVDRVERE